MRSVPHVTGPHVFQILDLFFDVFSFMKWIIKFPAFSAQWSDQAESGAALKATACSLSGITYTPCILIRWVLSAKLRVHAKYTHSPLCTAVRTSLCKCFKQEQCRTSASALTFRKPECLKPSGFTIFKHPCVFPAISTFFQWLTVEKSHNIAELFVTWWSFTRALP